MIKLVIATFAVVALTVVPAVQQGQFVNRWGEPPNLNAAGDRLHSFPRKVGDWKSGPDQPPLSEAVCKELGLVEHFHRRYRNEQTGQQVEVLLMVGAPGRLVRHPPDVCYANRANQQVGEPLSLELSGQRHTHQFDVLHFKRRDLPIQRDFVVAYAFSTEDGIWSSPSSPRMQFGGAPVLYKLQVLTDRADRDSTARPKQFLQAFVNEFSAVLVESNEE